MTIKTVSGIELNSGLLQVLSEDGRWIKLHYKQGDIDGAYAVYSVAFCMIYEQMINGIDASGRTSGDRLLRELLDNYGLIRPGFNFKNLKSIIPVTLKKDDCTSVDSEAENETMLRLQLLIRCEISSSKCIVKTLFY